MSDAPDQWEEFLHIQTFLFLLQVVQNLTDQARFLVEAMKCKIVDSQVHLDECVVL